MSITLSEIALTGLQGNIMRDREELKSQNILQNPDEALHWV